MKLYHFPSPNPQKVTFALLELGLDCEKIPVDLSKREQRDPAFLAVNPFGRVPVLVDGDLMLSESHAILGYLGETIQYGPDKLTEIRLRRWLRVMAASDECDDLLALLERADGPPWRSLREGGARCARALAGRMPDRDPPQ